MGDSSIARQVGTPQNDRHCHTERKRSIYITLCHTERKRSISRFFVNIANKAKGGVRCNVNKQKV